MLNIIHRFVIFEPLWFLSNEIQHCKRFVAEDSRWTTNAPLSNIHATCLAKILLYRGQGLDRSSYPRNHQPDASFNADAEVIQPPVDKVSVFVCGAQKAGTTSLYAYFLEHPELQAPDRKEIHFFDDETIDWTKPNYERLDRHFDSPAGNRLRYDVTPINQFWPNSLDRIASYNPDAKLIFLFRDPFERAVSQWAMEFARNAEYLDFGRAIREGRKRLCGLPLNAPEWRVFSYLERGLYGQQVANAL